MFEWRSLPRGSLAEIIVLDQFSRNIYRDLPTSFASDALALCMAQHAVEKGFHKELNTMECNFLLLPFMHSESLLNHEKAVELYDANGDAKTIDFEHRHKVIIEQFGRYPHRNSILSGESTEEELVFLKQPGSGF